MRKLVIVAFLMMAVVACQQKQEPKEQGQFPVGTVPTMGEIKLLQDVVAKDPGNVEAWIKLGNLQMDSSRFTEAVDAYQKALELDPKNVDVRVDLGTCYRNSGNPQKAMEEYRKALTINPGHISAQRNLAVVLAFDLKDSAQAIKEFERYLKLAPNAPDAEQVRQTMQALKTLK